MIRLRAGKLLEGKGLWKAGQWAPGECTVRSGAIAAKEHGEGGTEEFGVRKTEERDGSVLWDRAASERGELRGWALACGLGPGRASRRRGRPARGGGERAGPRAIGLESRRAALG